MFDWVQVRALAGPLKDIQRLVPKPPLHYLGCELRVVVLLEGEHPKDDSWEQVVPELNFESHRKGSEYLQK